MKRHPGGDNPFRSFWMGGFEGADHHNTDGVALDMVQRHGHLDQLEGDYARAASLGLLTVRESLGWRLCEPAPGVFDFSRPLRMARCARRHGLQILWTLMHYGTPPDLSLHDDRLIDRLAAFAAAAARALGAESDAAPVYTPVNEINFLAWAAAHTTLIGGDAGDSSHAAQSSRFSGYAIKRRLARATLAAVEAVRHVDLRARFMQVEPLVHVVAPRERPELAGLAAEVASYQWQTWDLLAGLAEPELGGGPAMLDLLGVNHYHNGQWEVGTERRLHWHTRDPRRRGFDALLADAWQRYGRPLVVSETSHVGAGRALWLSDMASQVARARAAGVPVWGMCLYPLVDRPDWNAPSRWHHSGLWDVAVDAGPAMPRVLHRPYARSLAAWQSRLPEPLLEPSPKPCLLVFSHRRWGLEQHRAQHLMTRLARHYHIVFVEAPMPGPLSEPACLVHSCPEPDVDVLCPYLPAEAGEAGPGFGDEGLLPLLAGFLAKQRRGAAIAWLCTPTALPLARRLHPRLLVYNAAQAATPVPSLALSLPDGVDGQHFSPDQLAPGGSEGQEAQRLFGALPGPLLGYIGSIDERLDFGLLAAVADARPAWQIVLVGPLRLADAARLPRRANLHWLGAQPYALLPYLLARWQVALLPLVPGAQPGSRLPPQIFEYLAGARPVVATPLAGLPAQVAAWVRTGDGTVAFVAACEAALAAGEAESAHRRDGAALVLAQRSWDDVAEAVHQRLVQALAQATSRPVPFFNVLPGVAALPARSGVGPAAAAIASTNRGSP
jgi:UDP-galactopyranose mutase